MSHSRRRLAIGRRGVLAGAGMLLTSPAVVRAQGQTNGVALVIGNSKYKWEASLPNVKRDAPDVAKRFQAMGLKTEMLLDLGRDDMLGAIDKFKSAAQGANLAVFYFAGHGVSWDKDTHLVPVDADLSSPSAISALVAGRVVEAAVKEAANRLLVFDNCRNNPADGWRQVAAQRAAFEVAMQGPTDAVGANTLVLYSTASGRVALDGPPGENSPFAATLLWQLAAESIDLQALPAKLRRDLLIATEGRQVLWDQSTYAGPLSVKGAGRAAGSAASSGWAGDSSRLIELKKVYAFARESGLHLPPGLVAYKPATESRYSRKAGSFKAQVETPVGPSPFLLIVLSVGEKTAEIIIGFRNELGPMWRFVTASVSGDRLEFVPDYGRDYQIFDWRDANSGTMGSLPSNVRGTLHSSPFTRLD